MGAGQSAQVVISPEFSYCNDCHYEGRGLTDNCEECGSENISRVTRIVGYYSVVENWNKSKKEELKARQRGTYFVEKEKSSVLTDVRSALDDACPEVVMENEEESSPQCTDGSCRL